MTERTVIGNKDIFDLESYPLEFARYTFAATQITEGAKVLEIGCSSGFGTKLLPNIEYIGIDNSKEIIEFAKKNFESSKIKFIYKNIEEFLKSDEKFDVIIAFEILEHLFNGLEIAQLLKSKCKKLLLSVPYFEPPGYWGSYHVLHRLTPKHFPNFDYQYIHTNGDIMNFPTSEDSNLLLMTWEQNKVYYKKERILCAIPTKDRYDMLYHCLQAVAMQTVKPDKLIIYDDGKREDMRESPIGNHIIKLLSDREIDWEVVYTPGIGQHIAHQMANVSGYDLVWRLDDDTIPEPNVLEKLLSHMLPTVGAVGGAVYEPGNIVLGGSSKIEDFFNDSNLQWGPNQGIHDVDHLYSSFLYRAGIVNYKSKMSNVSFHEETIFSYRLKLLGYRLIVDTNIKTYHFKSSSGGCRDKNNQWAYEWDQQEFMKIVEEEWGIKVIHLGVGIGDVYMFKHLIPELLKKYKLVVIGSCYNEILAGTGVKLISYECVKNYASENVYDWCQQYNWKGHLIDAYRRMYNL